jgi:hypothetical protein
MPLKTSQTKLRCRLASIGVFRPFNEWLYAKKRYKTSAGTQDPLMCDESINQIPAMTGVSQNFSFHYLKFDETQPLHNGLLDRVRAEARPASSLSLVAVDRISTGVQTQEANGGTDDE